MVERLPVKEMVVGSSPTPGASKDRRMQNIRFVVYPSGFLMVRNSETVSG